MTDPMPTILDILKPRHELIRSRLSQSFAATCTCTRFYMESMGHDESSRLAIASAFEQHKKEVGA